MAINIKVQNLLPVRRDGQNALTQNGSYATALVGDSSGGGGTAIAKSVLIKTTGDISTGIYLVKAADSAYEIFMNRTTPTSILLPTGLTLNESYIFTQMGAGQLTFNASTGVTISSGSSEYTRTEEQWSSVEVLVYDTNKYFLRGKQETLGAVDSSIGAVWTKLGYVDTSLNDIWIELDTKISDTDPQLYGTVTVNGEIYLPADALNTNPKIIWGGSSISTEYTGDSSVSELIFSTANNSATTERIRIYAAGDVSMAGPLYVGGVQITPGGGGVSQAYVDGSLATRDSSITKLFNQDITINASIGLLINADKTFATNASVGLALAPYATNASVGLALSAYTTNASANLKFTTVDGSLNKLFNQDITINASLGLRYLSTAVDSSFVFKIGFNKICVSSNSPATPGWGDLWIDTSI